VRDDEVDLAKLTFLKGLIIAVFQAKVSKWQNVQAAALALLGLALLAYYGGSIPAPGLQAVGVASVGAIAVAHVAIERYEVRADRLLRVVVRQMERLKTRGGA
jgi:peptidoglycan/LPS O-acetylase OafA/YrhL